MERDCLEPKRLGTGDPERACTRVPYVGRICALRSHQGSICYQSLQYRLASADDLLYGRVLARGTAKLEDASRLWLPLDATARGLAFWWEFLVDSDVSFTTSSPSSDPLTMGS